MSKLIPYIEGRKDSSLVLLGFQSGLSVKERVDDLTKDEQHQDYRDDQPAKEEVDFVAFDIGTSNDLPHDVDVVPKHHHQPDKTAEAEADLGGGGHVFNSLSGLRHECGVARCVGFIHE